MFLLDNNAFEEQSIPPSDHVSPSYNSTECFSTETVSDQSLFEEINI